MADYDFQGIETWWLRVLWLESSVTYFRLSSDLGRPRVELSEESGQVPASKTPLEGLCDFLVVVLETQEPVFEFVEGVEVGGGEDLSLEDREEDLEDSGTRTRKGTAPDFYQ